MHFNTHLALPVAKHTNSPTGVSPEVYINGQTDACELPREERANTKTIVTCAHNNDTALQNRQTFVACGRTPSELQGDINAVCSFHISTVVMQVLVTVDTRRMPACLASIPTWVGLPQPVPVLRRIMTGSTNKSSASRPVYHT